MGYDLSWGLGFGFGRQRICFDPGTLLVSSMFATAVGGGISAASTIAGGSAAETAGKMRQVVANSEATQLESNAAGELASSQRTAAETRLKATLARGSLLARAAGSGFNASSGSARYSDEALAGRGELSALTDVFNGENARTGLLNKASATRAGGVIDSYAGAAAKDASRLAAAGTIAGSAGSLLKTYGDSDNPKSSSRFRSPLARS